MKNNITNLLFLAIFLTITNLSAQNFSGYVNPFIGTGGHGHTYPGATVPFGMVQLSPDTRLEGWDGCGGYHFSDSIIYGLSHTHLSGTGVPDFCDILFMPSSENFDIRNYGYASGFSHSNETAHPGYYSVHLDKNKVKVELTATKRVGFHKYAFEGNSKKVVIDLKHRDEVLDSYINIVNKYEVEGYRHSKGWAQDQIVYFYAKFSLPISSARIFVNDIYSADATSQNGKDLKSTLDFSSSDKSVLMVKVGVSSVSSANAKQNIDKEIPEWDFEKVKNAASDTWNNMLGVIKTEGGTDEQKTIFYTSLYHTMVVPNIFNDVNGEYRGRDFKTHNAGFNYYTVFSLWDTYRAAHPLYGLILPDYNNDFIKTMLRQYEEGGLLPVWELGSNETFCMIGYHSVPVIADAILKGYGTFDYNLALEAMKASAMKDHFGLKFLKSNGFISSSEESESVSKTLEYAFDDWCISQVALKLGKTDDYKYFIQRAQAYKNIFDPGTGFFRARVNGGWFKPFDPREVNFNYTEANAWQYNFYVPQDISHHINYSGGKEMYCAKLDSLFNTNSQTTGREQSDITGLIGQYAHGNEPSHHIAYLYDYAGQPWKTQMYTRKIMDEFYKNDPDGLIGNEDCGQMSAWYVLSAAGIYPVNPSSDIYVFGTPVFPKIELNVGNNRIFKVIANNVSGKNIYIQSAKLNGNIYNRCYITYNDIINGAILEFEMGSEPNYQWGLESPVSSIDDYLITPAPYLESGDRTFKDSNTISIADLEKSRISFYVQYSPQYKYTGRNDYFKPFTTNENLKIKFFAEGDGLAPSSEVISEFMKIPMGRTIEIKYAYAPQYSAGGDDALIDYIRGSNDFRAGSWQGYEGVDLEVIIDLGEVQEINNLSAGFLQDINAWIFLPTKVEFEYSYNKKLFDKLGTVYNEEDMQNPNVFAKDFKFTLNQPVKARYIRVHAYNIGICPSWHKGSGHKSWIFADEIVIE